MRNDCGGLEYNPQSRGSKMHAYSYAYSSALLSREFVVPPHGHSLEKGIHVLLALLVLHDPLEVHPVPCKGLRQGIVVVAKVIARLDVDKWHKADPTRGSNLCADTAL